jgi:hypothetical protein
MQRVLHILRQHRDLLYARCRRVSFQIRRKANSSAARRFVLRFCAAAAAAPPAFSSSSAQRWL